MLAMTFKGPLRVKAVDKPMPEIEHPRDAIVRVTRACICGSDLHLYHGLVPDTRVGQTFGHETVGIVEEIGPDVHDVKVGDRVVVPFNIFCGECFFCKKGLYGNCHNTNPFATASGGFYGYSHLSGGYNGGQAEYLRVPFADAGLVQIPDDIDDDNAVLCTDIFPTGYQAAEMADIKKGDSVVVFGAGPVGLIAAKCAWFFGAGRVLVVDQHDYRLEMARKFAHAETVNFRDIADMVLYLKKESDWVGWDCAIDAVGCEAKGAFMSSVMGLGLGLIGGTATALNWAIDGVRKGGNISIVGVYGPVPTSVKIGDAMNKGVNMRMNQASVKRNVYHCFRHIQEGHINPKDIVTHRIPLEEIAEGYHIFSSKMDGCIKPLVIPPGVKH